MVHFFAKWLQWCDKDLLLSGSVQIPTGCISGQLNRNYSALLTHCPTTGKPNFLLKEETFVSAFTIFTSFPVQYLQRVCQNNTLPSLSRMHPHPSLRFSRDPVDTVCREQTWLGQRFRLSVWAEPLTGRLPWSRTTYEHTSGQCGMIQWYFIVART